MNQAIIPPLHWNPVVKASGYRLGDFVSVARTVGRRHDLFGEVRAFLDDERAIIHCGGSDFRVIPLRAVTLATRYSGG